MIFSKLVKFPIILLFLLFIWHMIWIIILAFGVLLLLRSAVVNQRCVDLLTWSYVKTLKRKGLFWIIMVASSENTCIIHSIVELSHCESLQLNPSLIWTSLIWVGVMFTFLWPNSNLFGFNEGLHSWCECKGYRAWSLFSSSFDFSDLGL